MRAWYMHAPVALAKLRVGDMVKAVTVDTITPFVTAGERLL